MNGRQWILLVVAVVFVGVLYSLPRSVVDNDALSEELGSEEIDLSSHAFELPDDVMATIVELRKSINADELNEKSSIFADSLVGIFMSYNYLDSAQFYVDLILQLDSSLSGQKKAGDLYFQLYGIASQDEQARVFANKAASCFEKILAAESSPDVQSKLAMTKVVTSNPMQGIRMLQSVLKEYPENKTAIYSLGVLSIQSGQYEKAVGRFEKLITIDPENTQAAYYLAVSYYETGAVDKAKKWFERIKQESIDPAIINSADQYLKELNEL